MSSSLQPDFVSIDAQADKSWHHSMVPRGYKAVEEDGKKAKWGVMDDRNGLA